MLSFTINELLTLPNFMKPSLNLHVLPTRIDCRQSYKDFYSHKDRLLGKGLEVLSHKPHIPLKIIQYFLSENKKMC